jgi:hypothetical protein
VRVSTCSAGLSCARYRLNLSDNADLSVVDNQGASVDDMALGSVIVHGMTMKVREA